MNSIDREYTGAFYTPLKWANLSKKYMSDYFGEDYQNEYYIWDCAAGTGNLLVGLTNKYKVFASTLDVDDVITMKERNGKDFELIDDNIFQFDFLNDSFDKCPQELQDIIKDEEKRKKLIIYINPPYAEAANKKTIVGTGTNKKDVAVSSEIYKKYKEEMGISGRELYIQFLTRIYTEIYGAYITNFSTLKILLSQNFKRFRTFFMPKLEKLFVVPANTFYNVTGKFPIGFFIWNTQKVEQFSNIVANVFDADGKFIEYKKFSVTYNQKTIIDWLKDTRKHEYNKIIGFVTCYGCDFQHSNNTYILNSKDELPSPRGSWITDANLKEVAIYISVRKVIKPTWINDRDQFLYPNDSWKTDKEFHTDCLAYALFNNNIKSEQGINNWIPFTEQEVKSKKVFESHFMTDYMSGNLIVNANDFNVPKEPLKFSEEAISVFDAGRELWKYYHKDNNINPNASLYDIKKYFQGTNQNGVMNGKSNDDTYNELLINLRNKLKILASKIEPKVYEHEFLVK